MIITSQQAAEKLRISHYKLDRLIRDGQLPTVNSRKPGAKKFFPKFDSRVIDEYRRTQTSNTSRLNGHAEGRSTPEAAVPDIDAGVPAGGVQPVAAPVAGIQSRLAAIEAKLDRLLQIWA